ncbi:hypothetical protein FCR2A7T_06180 [Flavobacterium cauense R2A-7]|uniref:Uncharacterized protein n=1 Tax=Flavobacterium cauense R2A-7 TaxID=1341154 RepID=V6S3T5_9FLAO|nr:hypothetical protein FCR2A7T_06180 [Flavobacterium cauense R2A-7]KGO80031.1 hypothetical protein Q762_13130 [Flavobacterium cauense R2A-7]TWI08970.1 hypothetical protein IP98_02683 [Flavobacterium cauense R2A-7]
MNPFKKFLDNYGVWFHSATLILWLWLLKHNFEKFQATPNTSVKIALIASVLLVCIAVLNLILSLKKRKKR